MKLKDERTLVSFDWAMKTILRDKANFDVLEGFLCALLEDDIKIQSILESEANQDSASDKFNRVDLLVEDSQGVDIIIEVQYSYASHYLNRLLFGTSKLITDNMEAGQLYSKVKKVISISLLYFLFGDEKQDDDYIYHGKTEFYGLHTGKQLSVRQDTLRVKKQTKKPQKGAKKSVDPVQVDESPQTDNQKEGMTRQQRNIFPEYYLIEIERFPNEVKNALDEWIYFFKHSKILDEFRAKNIQTAREKLKLMEMDEEEHLVYEKFLMNRASYQGDVQSAKESGLEEGFEKGLEKGREEGLEKGREESCCIQI